MDIGFRLCVVCIFLNLLLFWGSAPDRYTITIATADRTTTATTLPFACVPPSSVREEQGGSGSASDPFILTSLTGSIVHQNYTNNERVYWRIFAPYRYPAGKIRVQFTQIDTQDSSTCAYDYVQLYDGTDISATPLSKLCGGLSVYGSIFGVYHDSTNNPLSLSNTWLSSGTDLFIAFASDNQITRTGFVIQYQIGQ